MDSFVWRIASTWSISEQSETLINRQKLVDQHQDTVGELIDQVEAMRQTNESIEAPQIDDRLFVAELGDALEDYGLNCARVAANDVHNAVAVAFIQIATRVRSESWGWKQAMNWFHTGK